MIANLKERLELYIEMLEKEIQENQKMIQNYKNDKSTSKVLNYFKQRLDKIKNEFEITKKVINEL